MPKITAQAEKTIQKIAIDLPLLQRKNGNGTLMYRMINKRIIGHALPLEYKNKNDWYPTKYYTVYYKEPIFINHIIRLRDSFIRDGYDGLTHYVNALEKFVTENPAKQIVKEKQSFVSKIELGFQNFISEIKKSFSFAK